MYEITLYVKANGTLATEQKGILKLGTENEIKRTRLLFDVDSRIEGKYRYLKLVTTNLSCLYRISNNSIVLSKTITSQEGKWLVSFISTDELITNNRIVGNYAFITEPIEAVVTKGIMSQTR